MKSTRPNIALRALSLVTANWGLKLLALILAFVIYYSMKPSDGALQKTKFERTDERSSFTRP
ncbi:MAG: hypothetical protein J6P13_07765 [Kiritimatiellae bacterium]|nr:hypothetical protein [Kiritimatiellia bacterium]